MGRNRYRTGAIVLTSIVGDAPHDVMGTGNGVIAPPPSAAQIRVSDGY